MKRRVILTEMTVAVALGCALLAWVFDGSLAWLVSLTDTWRIERAVPQYSITPLDWGVAGRVFDVSDGGLVAGVANTYDGNVYAAVWDDGETTECSSPTDIFSGEAVAVTDDRTVAFNTINEYRDISHSYVWLPGAVKPLYLNELAPEARQLKITDMNADGTVVGMAQTAEDTWETFIWSESRGLQLLGDRRNVTAGISSKGEIVGMSDCLSTSGVPFAWAPTPEGTYDRADVLNPAEAFGRAYASNSGGVVVGRLQGPRPMRWDPMHGVEVLAPVHRETAGWAHDINDDGDIVGCITGVQGGVAVLWRDGRAINLNRCIPMPDRCHLVEATAINNAGIIACRANIEDRMTALLLVPVEQ